MKALLAALLSLPAFTADRITIVCDNTAARPGLIAAWGFSALVEVGGQRVLFDTGSKPELFLANLRQLGIDKSSITATVISHEHPENPSPIRRILPAGVIYFLDSVLAKSSPAGKPVQVAKGVWTTGQIDGVPPEQALLVETPKGLVMLVSCAHPGIGKMVQTAEKQRGTDRIRLLIGGLHSYDWTPDQIRPVIADLKKLRVESIVPAHCTGELATRMLHESYGAKWSPAGAGRQIPLD
ncbi:MAG: MBL fold metallo-hydrolase [Acidobacteriota bacterium]|nr:MBL fold metallo-hydrolase [Acidobacteriota bacterium]